MPWPVLSIKGQPNSDIIRLLTTLASCATWDIGAKSAPVIVSEPGVGVGARTNNLDEMLRSMDEFAIRAWPLV